VNHLVRSCSCQLPLFRMMLPPLSQKQAVPKLQVIAAEVHFGLGDTPKASKKKHTASLNKARRSTNDIYAQPMSFSPPDPYKNISPTLDNSERLLPSKIPYYQRLGPTWASTSAPFHLRQLLPPLDLIVDATSGSSEAHVIPKLWQSAHNPQQQVESILREIASCLHPRALQQWDASSSTLVPFGADPLTALLYPISGCMLLSRDKMSKKKDISHVASGKGGYAVINLAIIPAAASAIITDGTTRGRNTRRTAGQQQPIEPPPSSSSSSSTISTQRRRKTLKVMGVHRFVCWAFKGMPDYKDDDGTPPPELTEGEWRKLMQGMHCMHLCNDPACINPRHLKFGTREENLRGHPPLVPEGLRAARPYPP
jgi:hypothetical protein